MIFDAKEITLADGRTATLRSPDVRDAQQMLELVRTCAAQTHFMLSGPEEYTMSAQQEAEFLCSVNRCESQVMIVCEVNGELAGSCHIKRKTHLKSNHRATLAIALTREFWGLGIGTAMMRAMLDIAHRMGVEQVELEYIEGNERARRLYDKMGFELVSHHPNAIRLPDGTRLCEFLMIKKL